MTPRPAKTVVRPQLSQEAATYIRARIISGELKPGSPVLADAVADELGISTTPAREGLQLLRVEGFLQLIPRRGFVVAPLNGDDIRDLFRIQALIAGELAARAAEHANAEQIAELDALHHELIAAFSRKDSETLEEKNHAFHRHINQVGGTRKVLWALSLMTRYVPREFYAQISGWPQATVDDHTDLLDAIRTHDAEKARSLMDSHIIHSGELLAEHFDRQVASQELESAAG